MEVTISTLRSGVVRVEDAESSLYAAIDLVCDKVGDGSGIKGSPSIAKRSIDPVPALALPRFDHDLPKV